jgi:ribonuclease HII
VVVGVDEVGVGPLAGPMMACAIAFRASHVPIHGVTDSKKVTEKTRERLMRQILDQCLDVGMGWVDADEYDRIGASESRRQVLIRAVKDLTVEADHTYVDGDLFIRELSHTERVVKGDEKIWIVGAASIVAKQQQCDFMSRLHRQYPRYGFNHHHGYGTRVHLDALSVHGPCPAHRRAMKPVKATER